MSVRMIPSLTEDGDMRFDVFEHPKMTIVGRFLVNPTMDEVSMVANGAFCTREMVISKQKRSYFAARKDSRSNISEPYSVLLEMMPVARIYTSKIELEQTPFNILIADYCGDVFRAYPAGMGNAGVKIPVFLEHNGDELPAALIEKPFVRDTEEQSYAITGGNRAYDAFAITIALYDFMVASKGSIRAGRLVGNTFTAAPQLTGKYDDWVRITQEYWGATG